MPKYAKFMKDLLAKKGKAEETSKITLNERCSAVLVNQIPLKEKDPGSFTIPCITGKIGIDKTLADLGASINKFIFPIDFVVLDMEEDNKILIILGRPFLATAHAMIDVFNKKISFEVGNETITFDIEKSMKFSTPEDDTCLLIDIVDVAVLDHVQEILSSTPLDSFLFEPVINYQQRNIVNLWGDKNDEFEHEESGLSSKKDGWEPNDFIKPTLFATSTSETEAQLPKLKELSSHLEYAFLNDNHEFSVIISSLLSYQEKESLLQAKIVKLPDVGLIYAISDSPWVSPIHVVPKKEGMTVITNENNELVLTRIVIGWRDGFSGYFPIPLALEDQEKTTFTCPYGTFSYRRMLFGLCNAPATFQRCMMAIFHDMCKDFMEVFMDDFFVFDKENIDIIAKLPYPTNVKGVRSFLGHAGFYRRFIKDFSKITRPMTRLLMKDPKFVFSIECMQAFNVLKDKLTTTPVIVAPNWNLDFKLMCDASDYAVGAVLGQRIDKKFRPIH
ncbi:reverse transcriptase domain-containing protein [Tanacetum coccineum]|uniref:Reverse transcriptase domain-containing protein n=1 Tax=Tanacetum coccineum TaxID=301880 RepID=A0ABQ5JDR3_9ASTR